MTVIIDGGAGVTFPDTRQQTNALTNTGGNPQYYAARAWVTFNGSTTPPTILSASNVASVSRSSTGVFTVTFTSNMPNANYVVNATALYDGGSTRVAILSLILPTPTVSSFTFRVSYIDANAGSSASSDLANSPRISVAVFA